MKSRSQNPQRRGDAPPGVGEERRLFLVGSQRGERPSLLGLWHLCSLDAPSVAALWVWFVARAYGVHLSSTSVASMFLAVWMLYAADRLLDARTQGVHLVERHFFHFRYRGRFLIGIVISSCVLAVLLSRLTHAELRLFTALGVLLFAYFFVIHVWSFQRSESDGEELRLPKELAVGVFFPAAVFIPTVSLAPALRSSLLPSALLFAMSCTLNCLYVYAWEHPADCSGAHWTTRYATQHIGSVNVFTLSLCCLIAGATSWKSGVSLTALACGLSVLALLALNALRHRLSPLTLRASADLALLSPLLLIPLFVNFGT